MTKKDARRAAYRRTRISAHTTVFMQLGRWLETNLIKLSSPKGYTWGSGGERPPAKLFYLSASGENGNRLIDVSAADLAQLVEDERTWEEIVAEVDRKEREKRDVLRGDVPQDGPVLG